MSYETLIYKQEGRVATVILARAGAKNAINAEMAQELVEVCSKINQDAEVAVVIITGAGEEAFSVSAESSFVEGSLALPSELQMSVVQYPAAAVANLNCPVIAAINGDTLGQGLELALACDVRIAREGRKFGLPCIASCLIPWDGGTQRLPRLIGRGKAMEMLLTGELIDAVEACQIGLVNKVVSAEDLMPTVNKMAQLLSSKGPMALRYAKEAIGKGMELSLEQGLRLEADLYFLLQTTKDRTEGIRAFLEKRPPQFKGE